MSMLVIGVYGLAWSIPVFSNTAVKRLIAFINVANIGSFNGQGTARWTHTTESGPPASCQHDNIWEPW
ncbi:hypothetical protein JCM24511_08954 [Saitozyma sp. JCM 24511]|nr:hypothetical protein JCM24511_08954 [Saitozyma sp. JCM 24511]